MRYSLNIVTVTMRYFLEIVTVTMRYFLNVVTVTMRYSLDIVTVTMCNLVLNGQCYCKTGYYYDITIFLYHIFFLTSIS